MLRGSLFENLFEQTFCVDAEEKVIHGTIDCQQHIDCNSFELDDKARCTDEEDENEDYKFIRLIEEKRKQAFNVSREYDLRHKLESDAMYIEIALDIINRNKLTRSDVDVDLHGIRKKELILIFPRILRAIKFSSKRRLIIDCGRGIRSKDNVPILRTYVTEKLTCLGYKFEDVNGKIYVNTVKSK